jgi:hypothetical protein
MSGMRDRLMVAGANVREQQAEMRAERVTRRNRRLQEQADTLRTELDRERESREELLDLMKKEARMGSKGGAMRLIVVGGVAYLLGAKAGRARYEQIMAWFGKVRDEATRKQHELGDAIERETTSSTSTPTIDAGV